MYQPSHLKPYLPARKELTTFAVITILLIVATILNAILCTNNFNRGLKPHITTRKLEDADEKAGMTEMSGNVSMGGAAGRMTID